MSTMYSNGSQRTAAGNDYDMDHDLSINRLPFIAADGLLIIAIVWMSKRGLDNTIAGSEIWDMILITPQPLGDLLWLSKVETDGINYIDSLIPKILFQYRL